MDPILLLVLGNTARELITEACGDYVKAAVPLRRTLTPFPSPRPT